MKLISNKHLSSISYMKYRYIDGKYMHFMTANTHRRRRRPSAQLVWPPWRAVARLSKSPTLSPSLSIPSRQGSRARWGRGSPQGRWRQREGPLVVGSGLEGGGILLPPSRSTPAWDAGVGCQKASGPMVRRCLCHCRW
jgi:hypothetical protein